MVLLDVAGFSCRCSHAVTLWRQRRLASLGGGSSRVQINDSQSIALAVWSKGCNAKVYLSEFSGWCQQGSKGLWDRTGWATRLQLHPWCLRFSCRCFQAKFVPIFCSCSGVGFMFVCKIWYTSPKVFLHTSSYATQGIMDVIPRHCLKCRAQCLFVWIRSIFISLRGAFCR